MKSELVLSTLAHTWILDLDGTIVKHNGYKLNGKDSFLDGARVFLDSIPKDDMIIFITSRTDEYKNVTLEFLEKNNVRFDHIIFNAPYGERILINDNKPSGLKMSISENVERDSNFDIRITLDQNL